MDLVNRAPVHTDVVVGGPDVSITGVTGTGDRIPIIDHDAWVLPTVADRGDVAPKASGSGGATHLPR